MKEWRHITQEIGANIKVIDMPLLDTSKGNDSLDSRFVADLVLQILSYVANKELEANKARRDAGYKAMETQCKAVKRVSNVNHFNICPYFLCDMPPFFHNLAIIAP